MNIGTSASILALVSSFFLFGGCASNQQIPTAPSPQVLSSLPVALTFQEDRECRVHAYQVAKATKDENVATQKSHMGVGAIAGAGTGAVAGYASGNDYSYRRRGLCYTYYGYRPCYGYGYGSNRVANGAVGAAGGAIAGALIGLGTSQFAMKNVGESYDTAYTECAMYRLSERRSGKYTDHGPPAGHLGAEAPR
jgi:uncharacterized protein YcfJ